MRTGIANLPLHYGKMPPWLFEKMRDLAREITTFIVSEFGPEEMLKKLSDPFFGFRLSDAFCPLIGIHQASRLPFVEH